MLLTDIVFPNALAAWRLNEVAAFMARFDTDILVVARVRNDKSVHYSFDWEALDAAFGLHRYDLLIFDPAFNRYDTVNAPRADGRPACNGTAFNGALPAQYMLRLRKYAGERVRVDESVYDAAHHIFLHSYREFTRAFPAYPQNRQSIHLYPGGGFLPRTGERYAIHPDVLLFPTQAFALDYLAQFLPTNPAVPVLGAPAVSQGAVPVEKPRHVDGQPLVVCFTSLGDVAEKGADLYVAIAQRFAATHPAANVLFLGVGVVPPSPAVVALRAMPQAALDAFYQQAVDVIFNLDRTDSRHGWPLGAEGMVNGAVLFSTDLHGMNERNGYRFGEEVFIVDGARINDTVARLHAYYGDRDMLHRHSLAGQRRAHDLFGFAKQMGVVLEAVDGRAGGREVGRRRRGVT